MSKKATAKPFIPYIQMTNPPVSTKMDEIHMQQEYGGYQSPSFNTTPLPGISTPAPFVDFNQAYKGTYSLDRDKEPTSLNDLLELAGEAPNTIGGGAPYKESDYIGSGRYDYFMPGRDNEDAAAQQQHWSEVMLNGITKGAVLAGTTFLQTTVGAVNGLAAWANTGRFASFFDNEFNRTLDELNVWMEEAMPSYETQAFRDAAWYSPDYLFTGNFLWEGIVKNLGFAAGAAGSGLAFGSVLKGLGAAARAIPNVAKAERAIVAAEEAMALGEGASGFASRMASMAELGGGYKNILDKGYRATVAGLATTGEAGIEAYHNLNEFRQRAIDEYVQQNGYEPYGEDLDKINEAADKIGNTSFMMNMGLLGVTNYIQFPTILRKSFKADKAVVNEMAPKINPIVKIDGKYTVKPKSFLKKAGRAIANPYIFSYTEAIEEGGQFVISSFSEDYYDKMYRGEETGTVKSMIDSLVNGLDENFDEFMKNVLIGGLSGAIMLGPGRIGRSIDRKAETGKAIKALNSSEFSSFVKDTRDSVMRGLTLEEEYLAALENDNKLDANEAETNYVLNYLMPRVKYGRHDLVLQDIEDMRQLASTEAGWQQLQQEGKVSQADTKEEFMKRLDSLEATSHYVANVYNDVNLKYRGIKNEDGKRLYTDEVLDKMVYAASKINHYNTVLPELTSELIGAGIDVDAALGGNEVELEKAQLAILDLPDLTDDQAEDLIEKLNRAAVMNQYKKKFLAEYADMKAKPTKYKQKPLKDTDADGKPITDSSIVNIKTKKFPKGVDYKIGKKYVLGNMYSEDAKGNKVFRFPSIIFLGENEDGTVKIKDNKGVIRDVEKSVFEDYNLGSEEAINKSPDAKFYVDNANKITYWNRGKKKGGIVKGRIKWDNENDNLVFTWNEKGKTREKVINIDSFVAKDGYSKGAFYFDRELTANDRKNIKDAETSGRTAAKIKARQEQRAEILTQLYVDLSERHETTEKLIEKKKNDLATIKEKLEALKKDLAENAQADKRSKKYVKFRKVTRDAMGHSLKLARMINDLEQEIEQLEDSIAHTNEALLYIEDLLDNLDKLPDNTRDFLRELENDHEMLQLYVTTNQDQINAIKDLINKAKNAYNSAIDYITSLIKSFEQRYPDVPRFMGQDFVDFLKENPNFLKLKPNYREELSALDDEIYYVENETIIPNQNRINALEEHLAEMEGDMNTLEMKARGVYEVIQRFKEIYDKHMADKSLREAMMLNDKLHEEIIGTLDDDIPSNRGGDGYEPEAKKSKYDVPASTTVSTDFKEEHVLRANRFAFNFKKFKNKGKIKAVVVTNKTETNLIPGLVQFIKEQAEKVGKNVDVDKAIFAVFVQVKADGSYTLVGEDGKPLNAEQRKDAVNNAIFQPFPLDALEANYKDSNGKSVRQTMFREKDIKANKAEIDEIKNKYAIWRKQQLAAEDLPDPVTMVPSFGTFVYEQKWVDDKQVDDKQAKNNVFETGLITEKELETTQVLQVATTNKSITNNGVTYKTPLGRVFLNIKEGLVPMNANKLGTKKATVMFKVLEKLAHDLATEQKISEDSKKLIKWLRKTIHWGTYKDRIDEEGNVIKKAKPGHSNIWFDYAYDENNENMEPRLFISGLGFSMPLVPTSLQENRESVISVLADLYHNVSSKWTNEDNYTVPHDEIIDIDENGEVKYKTWNTYQEYLLSPKGRSDSSEIPLTVPYARLVEDSDVNREGIYFTFDNAQEMYEITQEAPENEEATPEQDDTQEEEEQPPVSKVTTVPIFDNTTNNIFVLKDGKAYAVYRVNDKGQITSFQLFDADALKTMLLKKHGPDFGAKAIQELPGKVKERIISDIINPALQNREEPPLDDMNNTIDDQGADELGGGTATDEDAEMYRVVLKEDKYETTENWKRVENWMKKNMPNIPFFRVQNIIRATKGRKALGMFHKGAIYVYENAENGTAFHEVFEAVWKMFTDNAEKKTIMDEFRARRGTFQDRETGRTIRYQDANSQELKEALAEEFRMFILKKEKARKTVIGRFFQQLKDYIERFLNWFKNDSSKIDEFFNAIDRGHYASYNPFEAMFENYTPVSERFIDIEEMEGDETSEFSMMSTINIPTKQLNDIIMHMTYSTILNLFKDDSSLMDNNSYSKADLYFTLRKEIQKVLANKKAALEKEIEKAEQARDLNRVRRAKDELVKTYQLWEQIKKDWSAIVDRHIENLQTYDIIFDENDYVLLNDEDNSGREDYLDARKIDPFKKSSAAVKLMLASLPVIDDRTGKPKRSSIHGFIMMDIGEAFLQLMERLHDSKDLDDMLKRLNNLATYYPNYKKLYARLTKEMTTKVDTPDQNVAAPGLKNLTANNYELLSSFWRTFKKQKPDIITVFILENGETVVTDTSLTSAAKQATHSLRNNIINAIKTKKGNGLFLVNKGKFTAINKKGGGFNAIELDASNPKSYSDFLKKLGIDFTPGNINRLTNNQKKTFFKRVEGIKNELSKIKDVASINKSTLNIEGNLFNLGVLKAIVENEEFQSTYFNVNGERSQTFIGPNALSNLYHVLANISNKSELVGTEYSYLLTDVFSRNSLILKKLFASDGDKIGNTSDLFKPVLIDGTVDQFKNRKADSSRLKYKERLAQEINSNLKGIYHNLVPGDASIEWGVRLHSENDPFVREETFDSKSFLSIFKNYLIDEINLINENRPTANPDNSVEFRFFNAILPKALQNDILRRKSTADKIVYSKALESKIDDAIMKYIEQDAKETKAVLNDYGLYYTMEGKVYTPNLNFTNEITNDQFNKQLKLLSANFMIANIELHKLVYSDPYQYSDELKRIKSFSSPRQALIHGSNNLNTALDRIYNRDYKEGDAGWSNMRIEKLRAVTLADVWSGNKELGEHSEELESYLEASKEGDGGGISTIKAKRKIFLRAGMWNERMEAQFRYDIAYEDFFRGKTLTDAQKKIFNTKDVDSLNPGVSELYTPYKPIVSGRKGNEREYNDVMLDKFALFPMSFRMLHKMNPESNMLKLYNKMQDENVDYAVFESGRKVGAESVFQPYKNGKINTDPFETKKQKNDSSLPQTVLNVPFSILSIQTEVPTKEKSETTQGSQITKLSTLDFLEAGVPIDYEVKDGDGNIITDINYRYNKWLELTEGIEDFEKAEDIRAKNSELYKEIVHNRRLLNAKTNLGYKKLMSKLGITKDAYGNLSITKRERMAVTLREEIFSRDVNDNISDSFRGFLNGDVILEGTPLYQQIRNILFAIARKNVIRPKINGGFKVQMFNTFFEENRIEKIKDSNGNDVYASGSLSFYKDEDGKRVCGIMVARWFDSPLSDDELLDYLNNSEEGQELLKGIGYRIPTQKQNSIDAFKIEKFLPKEMSDTVVVPTDLVRKVGSDFDIDKLSVYLKNALGGRKPKAIKFLTEDNSTVEERYFNWVRDIAGYDTKKYFRFLARDEVKAIREKYKIDKGKNVELYKEEKEGFKSSYKEAFEDLFKDKKSLKSEQDREMRRLFEEGADYYFQLSDTSLKHFERLKKSMKDKGIEGSIEIQNYLSLAQNLLSRVNIPGQDKLVLLKMVDNYKEELEVLGHNQEEMNEIQEVIDKVKADKTITMETLIDNIITINQNLYNEFASKMDEINSVWATEVARAESLESIEEFSNFSIYDQNASKSLDNAYIDSLFNLTTNKHNFKRLLVPNSADEAKGLAKKINSLLGRKEINYSLPSNMLSRKFMSELRHAFVTGKYAIGISAVGQTNHSQNQRTAIVLNENNMRYLSEYDRMFLKDTQINFKHHNTLNGRVTLSGIFSAGTKNYISDVIGQFIDGYVDISKGPWIMELGATSNVAGVWLFLLKAGVPFKDVAYFMNQPIIRSYIKELDNAGKSGLFSMPIVTAIRDEYQTTSEMEVTTIPSDTMLEKMIGNEALSDDQKKQQLFIFEEFLKYAKMSEHLLTYVQGSNFDTATFNDGLLVYKKQVQLEMARKSIISSVDENLEASFVGNLFDKIKSFRDGSADLIISESSGESKGQIGPREVIQEILRPYVSPYLNDKKFLKLGRKVVENLFDWVMQTGTGNNTALQQTFYDTATGKSTVKRIMEFKEEVMKNKNHPMHDNIVLKSLELDSTGREDQIDNVYIKAKDNKVFNQNLSINAFRELREYFVNQKSDLFEKFIKLAVLQSGLTNSHLSFTNLLPYEEFKQIYNDTISMLNVNPTLQDFLDLNEFQRTNPTDTDIVPRYEAKTGSYEDMWTQETKYWDTATTFMNKNLINAMKNADFPKLINVSTWNIVGNSDIVSWSWTQVPMTAADLKAGKKPWQKKREMIARGDYSFYRKGLFKKVYRYDENGNRIPLIDIGEKKNKRTGEVTIYEKYVYKLINTRGFGPRAQEHYSKIVDSYSGEILGKKSMFENGFEKTKEVSDKRIVEIFDGDSLKSNEKTTATPQQTSKYPVQETATIKVMNSLKAKYFKKSGRLQVGNYTFDKGRIQGKDFDKELLSLGYTEEQVGALLKLIC